MEKAVAQADRVGPLVSLHRPFWETISANVAIQALGIISGVLTARLLGPEGRGELAAVLLWPTVLSAIGCLSVHESMAYLVGKDSRRVGELGVTGLTLGVLLGLSIMVIGYGLVPALLGSGKGGMVPLARLYLLVIPLGFISGFLIALDQGRMRFTRYNLLRLVQPASYVAFLLALWFSRWIEVRSVVLANLVSAGVAALVVFIGAVPLFRTGEGPKLGAVRGLLQHSWRFHLVTMTLIVSGQLDQMFVVWFLDERTIGLYVVALTVAQAHLLFGNSFAQVGMPAITHCPDEEAGRRLLARQFRYAALVSCLTALALAATVPVLIPFLFGRAFDGSVTISWILILAATARNLSLVLGLGLRGLGHPHAATAGTIVGILLMVVLAPWTAPLFGAHGVAFSVLVASVANLSVLIQWSVLVGVPAKELWDLKAAIPKM